MKVQITLVVVAGLLACSAIAFPSLGLGSVAGAVGSVASGVQSVASGVGSTIAQVPATLTSSMSAVNQVLANLPTTMQTNYDRGTALITSALTGQLTFDQVYAALLTGAYVAVSNNTNTTDSLGGLGLPTAFLCQLGLHYDYTSCYVCNEDCYVAHNLWGGGCGASPITGSQTCLCAESADEAATRGLSPNSSTTCAKYNPVVGEESFAIGLAFRARYIAVQCLIQPDGTYDSTGCNVDCTQNHGYKSGVCEIQKPNVAMPNGTYPAGNDTPTAFCICSHTDEPVTTYNAQPSGSGSGSAANGVLNYAGLGGY